MAATHHGQNSHHAAKRAGEVSKRDIERARIRTPETEVEIATILERTLKQERVRCHVVVVVLATRMRVQLVMVMTITCVRCTVKRGNTIAHRDG